MRDEPNKGLWVVLAAAVTLGLIWFGGQGNPSPRPVPAPCPAPPAPAPSPGPAPPAPASALVAHVYSADWCPHCKAFAPVWSQWRTRFARQGLEWRETDCEADRNAAAAARIDALPTVILYRDGQEVRRWKGGPPEDEFARAVAGM